MLDLRRDRLDYTTGLLVPPDGWHFERAVATTYSLDLETLLAVLLPLAVGGERNVAPEEFTDGPLLLRALWRVAPRLTVFHQAGQIAVPRRFTPLHALLERILVPVALPPFQGAFPAFHPKTWTIEYRNADGESLFRFLVLSRNLTRDDSLDIALALESGSNRRGNNRTRPLVGFLGFLGTCIPADIPHAGEHSRRIAGLSRSLAAHPLALASETTWEGFDLLPLYDTVSRRVFADDPLFAGRPECVIAISPFLSESVVRRLTTHSDAPPVVLTRPEAYANLRTSIQRSVDAWALKDRVASPETDDPETRRDSDLHAKLYLRESPSETALILGSVNATESGMSRNVEFAVRLHASPENLGRDKLLADLFGKNPDSPGNPFERLLPGDALDPATKAAQADHEAAQAAIDSFCRCSASGRVEIDGALHAIVVDVPSSFSLSPRVRHCSLRPLALCSDCAKPAKGTIRFGELALAELSTQFVLAAETASGMVARVVRVPLENLDENARDAAARQAVVDANGGWAACLDVFFSPQPYVAAAEARERFGEEKDKGTSPRRLISGLYENMLLAAAQPGGRERFAELDIDNLLARQPGPEAARARELLAMFRQALPKRRRPK